MAREMRRRAAIFCVLLFWTTWSWAFEPFTIEDIRLEGLQRIAVGTVFNYLPLRLGDDVTPEKAANAIKELYKTGFFYDVKLGRDGDVLVVAVEERPSIDEIKISGNKDIETDQLKDGLKQIGLAKGESFDRSLLDKVEQELQRQYFSRGKYAVKVTSEVETLERNRVAIKIDLDEGDVARITHFNIVGNSAFSDSVLQSQLQSGVRGTFGLFSSRDQYSRPKLAGDLETLKSFYMDRGYIFFNVDSTQVSITPDKREVFITINVSEGERYSVKDVRLAGDLKVPEEELRALIKVKPGEIFSRRLVTESSSELTERLGRAGYAFSNVNPVPDIDREKREVVITFFVTPGKRIYVRRINVAGNTRTQDEVIRRELRQMEGAWIATDKINRSRVRLQRLGYFDDVNVEMPPVPGVEDQVDVNFSVTERSTGSLQAGLGYSESQGILVTASVSHDNFFGTGKRISAEVNNSKVNTIYSFSYTNPYYTLDGVSRGFRAFFRETDSGQRNTADYNADSYGAGVDYGFPLSEFNRASVGWSLEHTKINPTDATPQAYLDYLAANTDEFNAMKLNTSWSFDSRNKAIFPDEGGYLNFGLESAVPGSGIEFYKINVQGQWYQGLTDQFTLFLRSQIGFGDGLGSTDSLPFWEHYYAGGGRSVRGFRSNTLGPKEDGDPLGGAFKIVGNAEVIFPIPFGIDSKTVRMSAFYDIGNVYATDKDFDVSELRSSIGLSAIWLSPIGPMVFSLATPVREFDEDETETFQFTLGTTL